MKNHLSFIEIILAGIGFGFLGIFGRLAFAAGVSVGELLVFRFCLAAILLWAGLFLFRRDLLKLSFLQIGISSLLGVAGYAVFSTMYFKAIQGVSVGVAAIGTTMLLTLFLSGMQKISSSKASIIVTIEPVTAAVAGWFILGEALAIHQVIGAGIVLSGLVLNRK